MHDSSINISDVAKHAGVSTATVSRVLSDKRHVSEATRQKVWKAVEELGYRPNRVARRLRVGRADVIGLVIPDILNPFFTVASRAIQDVAQEADFSVILCNTDEDPKKEEKYLALLEDEAVAGIIFCPAQENNQTVTDTFIKEMPFVTLDRRLTNVETDHVLLDNVNAAREIVTHLIEQGHSRIGAITGKMTVTTGRERQEGYKQALLDHGIEYEPMLAKKVIPKIDQGRKAALELMNQPNPPTAIFTGSNLLTIGLLHAIQETSLAVPDDIAIAGFDELPFNSLALPWITTIQQPNYELGKVAAELLLERIRNPIGAKRQVMLRGEMIVRQSSMRHKAAL